MSNELYLYFLLIVKNPSLFNRWPLNLSCVLMNSVKWILLLCWVASAQLMAQTTWTGATDNNWSLPGNWTAGVPDASDDVIISSSATNQPIIEANTMAFAKTIEIQNGSTLTLTATGSLTINGSKSIANFTTAFSNNGTLQNNGRIIIGTTTDSGQRGLSNQGVIQNNIGGEIRIDRTTRAGLWATVGSNFTNAGKIIIGANQSLGYYGFHNAAPFQNTSGGEIMIDRTFYGGLVNNSGSNFINEGKITIGANQSVGDYGFVNIAAFQNNSGGEIYIDRFVRYGLTNESGSIINAGKMVVGAKRIFGEVGIGNKANFQNIFGGQIHIDQFVSSALTSSYNFTNSGKIILGANQSIAFLGNSLVVSAGFQNTTSGEILVFKGSFRNNVSESFINAGFIYLAATLINNTAFTNMGVLRYSSLSGKAIVNSTNSALVVNNAPTPIFTYGGDYDGNVEGIFKDTTATISAGLFTAPNTFTHSGLLPGQQTLYAKITPSRAASSYVLPFSYVVPPVITKHPVSQTWCSSDGVMFSIIAIAATEYQWQVSTDKGETWVDNIKSQSLTIGNLMGLSGNWYRCIAKNLGGSDTSNHAILTVKEIATPTASVTQQPTCSTPTGTIVVTAPNGNNFQYFLIGRGTQASPTFIGLAPNSYNVVARNTANGCYSIPLSLTVNPVVPPTAAISYDGSPYVNSGTASVTLTGTMGGTFTSTPGLVINPASGQVDLVASTPSTYTVTYTIASTGSCAVFQTSAKITIDAHVLYVNFANTNSYQDGSSWSNAFSLLQMALTTAAALPVGTVEIRVAKGIYTPGIQRSDAFILPSSVKIYGGFEGNEYLRSQRNWKNHPTILSGEIGAEASNDNVRHVVIFSNTADSTRLDGFTIVKGFADFVASTQSTDLNQPTLQSSGAGILAVNHSKGIITNCIITDNKALFGGGILMQDSSTVRITQTIIYGNEATFGGGLYLKEKSNARIENTLIASNKGIGGGLYVNRSEPVLLHCTIATNKDAGNAAGGIYNANARPIITNSILWGNTTPQSTDSSAITYSIIQDGYAGLGNSNQDPLFVKPTPIGLVPLGGLGDYHLQPCSPAINSVVAETGSATDIEGNVRPFAMMSDKGAYESKTYGSGPANLTLTENITTGTVIKTAGKITAVNQISSAVVIYEGSESVNLLPGFLATDNTFLAVIGGCTSQTETGKEAVTK